LDASLFHLFGWRDVIHTTYGHATYYLMLTACDGGVDARAEGGRSFAENILGVLPVVHLKHALFGHDLVSLPFLDGGGILADSREAEESLLSEVIRLGRKTGASRIDLRHERLLACCNDISAFCSESSRKPLQVATKSNKVRMLLNLPDSSEMLMKSFKSKLRSQISKPLKEGLTSRTGGAELLEDFYRVFLVNMRDLGSPVHSVDLMRHVLGEFSERSRIFVVYKSEEPVASALVVGFDKVLRNPWASFDRKYASMGPNMLLYLRMLEFACDNGYQVFDFGRSTKGEGTYRFKEQWGAVPARLHWYLISLDGKSLDPEKSGTERFEMAAYYWRKLPLIVTKVIGPRIRKHISL
ncbi:MAG: FemAB family PEP-CTERM system-associated protein, partial [Nitrososphaera sp.]|nr:FemAB family PEP-CTERM system-associated protein [Nitrososphaera sp.]